MKLKIVIELKKRQEGMIESWKVVECSCEVNPEELINEKKEK